MPLGWVHVAKGPVMAGAEEFKVKIIGRGGHGAMPQTTIDPVSCAAQIVSAAQTIVSRNVAPLETAVVSFTVINGGTAFNVIPQEVTMEGTIRTFEPSVRERVVRRFEELVKGVASAMGCQAEVKVKRLTPALINADEVTAKVQETARRVLPGATHDNSPYLTMGAEDMAYIQEKVDGCYFFIGSNNAERHLDYSHHHPKFDFDEQALISGAALMSAAAMDILK
jgi:amidohydrolase